MSTSGDVDSSDVDALRFVVATAPGSDPIDLDQTTLQFIGEQGEVTVTGEDVRTSAGGEDNIIDIQGLQGDSVLTDNSDRAEIAVNLDDTESGDALGDQYDALDEGERLTVIFTTASGASTEKEIRVPTTITDNDESVRL